MKKLIMILGVALLTTSVLLSCSGNNGIETTETSSSVDTINGTKSCLVGYDWTYPSSSNPSGAWKFSSDGTFNSSSTMFGGMSTWGNWVVTSPGKIKVSYTRTTEVTIPSDQILTMSSCYSLKVGSTNYSKE